MTGEAERESSGISGALRRHPVIAAVWVGCTLGGALAGWWLLGEDWSVLRRLLAGAVSGAGISLLVTATKLVG